MQMCLTTKLHKERLTEFCDHFCQKRCPYFLFVMICYCLLLQMGLLFENIGFDDLQWFNFSLCCIDLRVYCGITAVHGYRWNKASF